MKTLKWIQIVAGIGALLLAVMYGFGIIVPTTFMVVMSQITVAILFFDVSMESHRRIKK